MIIAVNFCYFLGVKGQLRQQIHHRLMVGVHYVVTQKIEFPFVEHVRRVGRRIFELLQLCFDGSHIQIFVTAGIPEGLTATTAEINAGIFEYFGCSEIQGDNVTNFCLFICFHRVMFF